MVGNAIDPLATVVVEIRARLDEEPAENLAFLASDDQHLFAAVVLAEVRTGLLALSPDSIHCLHKLLRDVAVL